MKSPTELPLAGIKVLELSHMVMGPAVGLVLADLGAEVIKVEPIGGDKTRNLRGSGAGYFSMYNRNKRSLSVDLKSEAGKQVVMRLVKDVDILIENFRPGAMQKLGFDYDQLKIINPNLIYYSAKGFLNGPYEHRTALDEVAQMMSGLAYMTGPPGKPLRAGASVIDVMGGMFGVIGILAALEKRHNTGHGEAITSSLYESAVFLVGQHMAQYGVTGEAAEPMPTRISAWAVYDVFETKDQQKLFVGVVSDSQWVSFCERFELTEFSADQTLTTNRARVNHRERIIPAVQAVFKQYSLAGLTDILEATGLPYAPIMRPQDMFEDEHMRESGGLLPISIRDDESINLPALPVAFGDSRFGVRRQLPGAGEHTKEILIELGYTESDVQHMLDDGIAEAD